MNIGTPIIDIIRDGKKEVELNISSRDRKLISVGNLVTLTDDNEIQYKGFVSRIGNFVNAETQNISVFVEIPKKSNDGYLFNGMYLNAQIETYSKVKVCVIPRRSLISNNEIFILNENDLLEVRSINITTEQDNNIIVGNINDGERVIIEPLVNVKTGTKVIPLEL